MARAYAEAGLALDGAGEDSSYSERAADAVEYVRSTLWDGDRLARRVIEGDIAGVGYAEDYAYLAAGALATYEATGDRSHLGFAMNLADALVDACYDAETGALYQTPADVQDVDVRSQAVDGGPTPSPVGVAAETLLVLDAFDPGSGYADAGEAMLERYGERVQRSPAAHPTLALAADTLAVGHREITVAADETPAAWRATVGAEYLPDRLFSRRPRSDDELEDWLAVLEVDEAPPIWAGRESTGGPTAYVCRRACSPPLSSNGEIAEWLAEFSR
jgi:uncharacterized protein YyaL (SSP411 family)